MVTEWCWEKVNSNGGFWAGVDLFDPGFVFKGVGPGLFVGPRDGLVWVCVWIYINKVRFGFLVVIRPKDQCCKTAKPEGPDV